MTLTRPDVTAPATDVVRPLGTTPRPEYPRPDLDRSERWASLNGSWSFDTDSGTETILVPFAWETEASGVHRTWLEYGVYRRQVAAPADWHDARIVLCFGAVHHHAVVRVDGAIIGEHTGGYESFEFDITDHLVPGIDAELTVEVTAPADKRSIPHGKQRSIPRDDYDGVSFTPTSGIWQSVWLEARGSSYAAAVTVRGDSLTGFDIVVDVAGDDPAAAPVEITVVGSEESATLRPAGEGRAIGRLEVVEPKLWCPADPHLYQLKVTVGGGVPDEVVVTAGLRRIETRGEQLYLNGQRLYIRGVLDQGYWPDTGLTAPSAEALRHDITLARELGYNLVRKHLKFEEPLWLHEADRTGMLVWAEPACPSRYSPAAAAAFEAQISAMVQRDGNHPSIIIWGLYNEEWGLDWDIPGSKERAEAAAAAYDKLRALDDSRPIVENSGWSHIKTDLVDWHYYEPDLATWKAAVADLASGNRHDFPVRLGPDFTVDKSLYGSDSIPRTGIPILNSEYGEGFTSLERAWHLRWETQELRRQDRFAGYVYTEFADVEHEFAGLLTAHRKPKDWGGAVPADINAETVLILDMIPLSPGADITIPHAPFELRVRISHHGAHLTTGTVHATWQSAGVRADRVPDWSDVVSDEVTARPFLTSEPVTLTVPSTDGPGRLMLWYSDTAGRVVARGFLDAAEIEPPNRRGAR